MRRNASISRRLRPFPWASKLAALLLHRAANYITNNFCIATNATMKGIATVNRIASEARELVERVALHEGEKPERERLVFQRVQDKLRQV